MRHWSFSVIVALGMISFGGRVCSQSNTSLPLPQMWPGNPPVGIGTQLSLPGVLPFLSLQLHYDPTPGSPTQPAILLLSNGNSTTSPVFGILGLMPPSTTTTYSSLSKGQDLILHENKSGDLILTNYWPAGHLEAITGGYIRFATAGDLSYRPDDPLLWRPDYERMLIAPNGNIGINLPKDSIPVEQFQLGGGTLAPPGETAPLPGLTMYGGNRYEGMPWVGGGSGIVPFDYRSIAFNVYHNPWVAGSGTRFKPMGSSAVAFAQVNGGLLEFDAWPYTGLPLTSLTHAVTMQITGHYGLSLWSREGDSDHYDFLLDIRRPGVLAWPDSSRNPYGFAWHHTPVFIGRNDIDFYNLPVHPNIGDSLTWMLAVDGPALFKEAFVSTDWPDFVFDPTYVLPKLPDVEAFIKANNHLPGVPSAKEIATTGVPLGATSAKQMQKTEELTLYIIELNKKIERLEAKVQDLESKKER